MTSIIANGRSSFNHECGINVSFNDQLQVLEDRSSKQRTVAMTGGRHHVINENLLNPHSHHPKCKQRVTRVTRLKVAKPSVSEPGYVSGPEHVGFTAPGWTLRPMVKTLDSDRFCWVKARHYMSVTSNCS